MKLNTDKKKFIIGLAEAGAIKFGQFKLKSGQISPFYIDLRDIVSFPFLMKQLQTLITEHIKDKDFDLISGIPYTALPMASLVSVETEKPLVYMRKEKKDYGTGKIIEGRFEEGQKCLVIDDVMTTGESKIETAKQFEKAGVQIAEFVIVIDRSNNGQALIEKQGYQISSLFSLTDMLEILLENGYINEDMQKRIIDFVHQDKAEKKLPGLIEIKKNTTNLNTLALLDTMQRKQSNLVASIDVSAEEEFFNILDLVAPHIAMVKTHVDIIKDYSFVFVERLRELSDKYDFMVFEDRKFADIGNTVRKQFREGIYRISDWSDFVTVHGLPGPGILEGLFDETENNSAFLLAKMSAAGNLLTNSYFNEIIEMGKKYPQWVSGFIGFAENETELSKLRQNIPSNMLLLMPGVSLSAQNDNLGQRYVTAEEAVRGGADLIIVGRGIYGAEDPGAAAEEYKRIGWQVYQQR